MSSTYIKIKKVNCQTLILEEQVTLETKQICQIQLYTFIMQTVICATQLDISEKNSNVNFFETIFFRAVLRLQQNW